MDKKYHYCIIITLVFIAFLLYAQINWNEVNEWEEQWGGRNIAMMGTCPPMKPYGTNIMLIPLILYIAVVYFILIQFEVFGDDK